MPSVDVIDEMFVVASPEAVRAVLCDEARWKRWFPGLTLRAYVDRGPQGVRWNVAGNLFGTLEVWLEERGDGTVVHTFVRAEPSAPARRHRPHRLAATVRRRYALPLKQRMWEVKDALEAGRVVGLPRVPVAQRVMSPPPIEQQASDTTAAPGVGTSRPADQGTAGHGRPDHVEHPDRG